ncbi:glutathione S-transferase family protein [Polymorphobacter sp.]|uniref:glutathione S-transferase family protein n=1 Tax=Polymorphobacter sp. TaxID=1909290 RepID=UPI003F703765
MSDIKLYGALLSPFVMRPVLVARAKGHELAVEPFPGGNKSPEYLALSPIGKIPLLVQGDFVLTESQVIAEYLDAALPGPALMPADPQAAARVRLLVRIADLYLTPHLVALFRGRENPEVIPGAMAGMAEALGYLEHFRNGADSHAVGDSFSQADAALIPLLFFVDALDPSLGTGKLLDPLPGLAGWWKDAKAGTHGARAVAEQAEAMRAMMAVRAAGETA